MRLTNVEVARDLAERDDAELIRGCSNGDERAWKTLLDRYRRLIFSIPVTAYKMPESESQEIFQRVVVKLFENVGRLRSSRSLPAWLVTVARNECRRYLRRASRWSSFDEDPRLLREDPPDLARAVHAVECEHRLSLAFERLDDTSRELLSALYLEEPRPSYTEIARRLGRPVGSLGPTRARSLEKLRRVYLELGGSEGDAASLVRSASGRHGRDLLKLRTAAV